MTVALVGKDGSLGNEGLSKRQRRLIVLLNDGWSHAAPFMFMIVEEGTGWDS